MKQLSLSITQKIKGNKAELFLHTLTSKLSQLRAVVVSLATSLVATPLLAHLLQSHPSL